ncbi:MAG: GGDEF domain-containing protein [Trueperaceae bacterium]|nr:GGDEF domain-containing protein [Trueperaceae bacterium]
MAAATLSALASLQRNRSMRALEDVRDELSERVAEVEALRDELQALALRDPLTGVQNRRILDQVAPPMMEQAERYETATALVLIAVDHFKTVNDEHGHLTGDTVLVDLAGHLRGGVRGADVVVRYGGEEFAVLMPGVGTTGARARVEALRAAWRRLPGGLRPTLSVGIAAAPDHGVGLDDLMRAADEALYRAKRAGRDRVEVASDRVEMPQNAVEATPEA